MAILIEKPCGRFSAAECRALLGEAAVDMRSIGAPEHIMLRVLEARAKFRTSFKAANPNAAPGEWRSAMPGCSASRTAPRRTLEDERRELLRGFAAVGEELPASDYHQEMTAWFNAPPKVYYGGPK